MTYLTHVTVNWMFGGDKFNFIPEVFEWRTDDNIAIIDKTPIVLVSKQLYDYIERGHREIPEELLKLVEGKFIVRKKDGDRVKQDWGMVITDGTNVLAVSTEGTNTPFFKSRIAMVHEETVIKEAKLLKEIGTDFIPPPIVDEEEEEEDSSLLGLISDLKPEYMLGLSRKERELKYILLDAFFDLACSTNVKQIRYWYIEMFPYEYEKSKKLSKDKMLRKMFDTLKMGWTDTHSDFGSKLVNTSNVFRDLWSDVVDRPDVSKARIKKIIK